MLAKADLGSSLQWLRTSAPEPELIHASVPLTSLDASEVNEIEFGLCSFVFWWFYRYFCQILDLQTEVHQPETKLDFIITEE